MILMVPELGDKGPSRGWSPERLTHWWYPGPMPQVPWMRPTLFWAQAPAYRGSWERAWALCFYLRVSKFYVTLTELTTQAGCPVHSHPALLSSSFQGGTCISFPAPDVPDFHPNTRPLGPLPHVCGPLLLHQRPRHCDDRHHPLWLCQFGR